MMSKHIWLVSVAALLVSGCLERNESITVHEDGSASWTVEFKGDVQGHEDFLALPQPPEWDVTSMSIDSTDEGKVELHWVAHREIPHGDALPSSFAGPDREAVRSSHLQFPSGVKRWREGSRTYYEFTRHYRARTYGRHHELPDIFSDAELEERVLEHGIFNVSEADRNQYLDNLSDQLRYTLFNELQDGLGILVLDGGATVAQKRASEEVAWEHLGDRIDDALLLDVLAMDEDEMDLAYEQLLEGVREELVDIAGRAIRGDGRTPDSSFRHPFRVVYYDQHVTDAINMQVFQIELVLPGEIVRTNGYTEPGEPGQVMWMFDGAALHDRDVPLYALSVVEHP